MAIKLTLLLALAFLFHFVTFGQSIPVQITQDTLKACQVNYMTAVFIGTNTDQHLTLSGELDFGQNSIKIVEFQTESLLKS